MKIIYKRQFLKEFTMLLTISQTQKNGRKCGNLIYKYYRIKILLDIFWWDLLYLNK